MDQAPEVDLEQLAHVRLAHLLDPSPDANAGIVHPAIDPTKPLYRGVGDRIDLLPLRDVAMDRDRLATSLRDRLDCLVERIVAARGENNPGALAGSHLRRGKSNAAGGAGDHDHLLGNRLQLRHPEILVNCHTTATQRLPWGLLRERSRRQHGQFLASPKLILRHVTLPVTISYTAAKKLTLAARTKSAPIDLCLSHATSRSSLAGKERRGLRYYRQSPTS
jgi:hypothetical protein